jgi:single-strand DNA-binding protein
VKERRRGNVVGAAKDSLHRKGLAHMSQDNQITLRGYLTAEPKLYQKTPTTTPVTELRVGSTPRRLNRETGEWQDLPTSYYRVKCWRRLAINAASSLKKGDTVVIRGRFYMTSWVDSEQRPRSTLQIEADSLGHDLAYGWSHFLRGTRSSGNGAAVNSGEVARQDAGSSDPGDDEYPADMDTDGPDESEEAVADTRDAQGTTGGQAADGEGDGLEPGDTPDSLGVMSDPNLLEREAMPF